MTDTGDTGFVVVYLNGQFTTHFHWKKVDSEPGTTNYRRMTYDERARGKSATPSDYSFPAGTRDINAVLAGRGVDPTHRIIVVGWSYGAYLVAHEARKNPERCKGAVLVDGACPYD